MANKIKRLVLFFSRTLGTAILIAACATHSLMPANLGSIAFVNRTDTTNHIFLMDINANGIGSTPTRLTSDPEPENYPAWSPDGKRLTYSRDYNGSAIYVVNADGSGQQRLSPTPGFDATASWSPDGSKIIYVRVLQQIVPNQIPITEIHVMKADGTHDKTILAQNAFSVEPRWSVKNQIVFMQFVNGYNHIFIMDTTGNHIQQLTTLGNNSDPAWSTDGTKISFGSDREGNGKLNIFTMNADGSNATQVTHFLVPDESGDTSWSSGEKIVFEYDINGKKQSDPKAFAEVWTVGSDGTNPVFTKQPCSGVGCAPRWRPGK